MIRRSTLVLLVIFAALLAGTIFWQRSQEKQTAEVSTTPEPKLLFNFTANLTRLRLERAGNGMIEFSRDENGVWELTEPPGQDTDTAALERAVSQLLALTVLSTLEEAPSLESAGLAPPSYRLLISIDDNSQAVMEVGKVTPTGGGYYVLVSNQDLSIVSRYGLESFLNLLDNPPIKPTPTLEVGNQDTPESALTPAP